MVNRVLAVSLVMVFSLITPMVHNAIAEPGQPCYAPACPPPCAPPSPFLLCGSLLGKCSTACGVVLRAPACIMMGVLAPPPCAPACGQPAPCPAPRVRVSKTRPVRTYANYSGQSYACGPQVSPICGGGAACAQLAEMPMRFAAGFLSIPPGSGGYSQTY